MTQRRTEAITEAIEHLDWCSQPPHDIDRIAGIYAEAISRQPPAMRHGMSNDDILASITSRAEGGGGKGGHSDPTARAALWGEPDAPDDGDETLRMIAVMVDAVLEYATELDGIVQRLMGRPVWVPQTSARTRSEKLRMATTYLHHALPDIWVAEAGLADVYGLIRNDLLDTARWLHEKAAAIWEAHHGDRQQVAVRREIKACRICGDWRKDTIAAAAGRCTECDGFFRNHQCERTETIVRKAEAGRGPSPGDMIEARATRRAKAGTG